MGQTLVFLVYGYGTLNRNKIMVNITAVANPKWADAAHTCIECMVTIEGLPGTHPFGAHPKDMYDHGRQVFQDCVDGKYGVIAEFIEPPDDAKFVIASH